MVLQDTETAPNEQSKKQNWGVVFTRLPKYEGTDDNNVHSHSPFWFMRFIMKNFGLSTLVHPSSAKEFVRKIWPAGFFVSHGRLERMPQIASIPELANAESLIDSWRGAVSAWPPLGSGLPDFKAESHQLHGFYQAGYTLYFRHVEGNVPALVPIIQALEKDLGLQEGNIFCDAFASRGRGVAPHFDPDMSFNLQLVGKKQWTFAKNEHVTFPLVGTMMHRGIPEEMKGYCHAPFPKRMPNRSKVIQAREGTLFFIPHGMWHTTKNFEPSLLLSFTVLVKSNSQLMADEICERLSLHEHWRDRSGDLLNSKIDFSEKKKRLSALLRDLQNEVASLDADELLAKWGGTASPRRETRGKKQR